MGGCPHPPRPWAVAQTCLLTSTSRSWASAHTDQGRRKRASPGPLRFLNSALPLVGMDVFQALRFTPQNVAADAVPSLRDSSLRSRTSCSAPFLNAVYWLCRAKDKI